MSHKVTLLPSGHTFVVETDEPIIEAALREGLSLALGCSTGNCGACKARLVRGEVHRLHSQDYAFSAAEKGAGYLLTCVHTAASDLVLEAQEAVSASDIPLQEIRCALRKIESGTEGSLLLHLKTPRSQALRFLAGQRVRLTARDGLSTELPVASCPCDGRSLLFALHERPDDPFLRQILAHAGSSQTLVVTGPRGEFLLGDEPGVPLVFVAFDLGVAPIKSMVEHALALDDAPRIDLYRTRRGDGSGYLDRLFGSWDDALENFRYTPLPEQVSPAAMAERITTQLADTGPEELYLAGPRAAVEAFCARAEALGRDPRRIHSDIVE